MEECTICMENRRFYCDMPCKHKLCVYCLSKITEASCPFCRASFDKEALLNEIKMEFGEILPQLNITSSVETPSQANNHQEIILSQMNSNRNNGISGNNSYWCSFDNNFSHAEGTHIPYAGYTQDTGYNPYIHPNGEYGQYDYVQSEGTYSPLSNNFSHAEGVATTTCLYYDCDGYPVHSEGIAVYASGRPSNIIDSKSSESSDSNIECSYPAWVQRNSSSETGARYTS